MKFKVGDKVKNKYGEIGEIQEVLNTACFVNYGDFAEFEYFIDLEKLPIKKKLPVSEELSRVSRQKLPTSAQAFKSAQKEKEEQEQVINMTNLFCEYLGKI